MVGKSLMSKILLTCSEIVDGKGWLYTVFGRKGISQFMGKLFLNEEGKEIALFKITATEDKLIKRLLEIVPLIADVKADTYFVFVEHEEKDNFECLEVNPKKARKINTLINLRYSINTLIDIVDKVRLIKWKEEYKPSEMEKAIKEMILRTIN